MPPLVVVGLLRSLGLPEQLFIAAVLVVAAWYIRKGVTIGRLAGAVVGSVAAYVVAALVVLAVAVALGWLDPNPSRVVAAMETAKQTVVETVGGWLADRLAGVVP